MTEAVKMAERLEGMADAIEEARMSLSREAQALEDEGGFDNRAQAVAMQDQCSTYTREEADLRAAAAFIREQAERVKGDAWMPIETAPRGVMLMMHQPAVMNGRSSRLPARTIVDTHPVSHARPTTHWRPLPPPPGEA